MASFRPPRAPAAHVRELSAILSQMVAGLGAGVKSGLINGLAFADAGPSKANKALADKTRRALITRYSDARITKLVRDVLRKTDRRNRSQMGKLILESIGLSTTEIGKDKPLLDNIDRLMDETTQWVIELRDDTLAAYTERSLDAVKSGRSLRDVLSDFDGLVEQRKGHAKSVARGQIANFNSVASKLRSESVGITEAIWRDSSDGDRVRPSHQDRDGKTFKLDKGLYSALDGKWLLPGVDYGCRCTYEFVIPTP